jgi:hypothetical protein
MAKCHLLGGQPISALPHALEAVALSEAASRHSHLARAHLLLAEVQLEISASRALALLRDVRPHVAQHGSTYEHAQLQLLTAKARLAAFSPYEEAAAAAAALSLGGGGPGASPVKAAAAAAAAAGVSPGRGAKAAVANGAAKPTLQQFKPHILPALADALKGFAKLRCHAEVAECLYLRARVWHTAGAADEREADAQAFAKADAEAQRSAVRLPGRLGEYAEVGVLEAHLAQLRELDGAQGA